jgi:tetratricopeptide (TPR) repeat protein
MMRHRKFSQSVRWLLLASLLIPTAALADDPHFEFIEGLRQRRYFDTALEYIDQLAARTDIPAEDREVLDLQRGLTYRAMGSQSRVPEDREQLLGQAEQFLKKFVDEHGAHQEAAFANSQLGELLFERARTLIWKTESPGSESRKTELQQQARQLIGQATSIYQKAHDLYKQQYEAFPKTFIDEDKEPEKYAARVAAEAQYLRAWFNLARCS